MTGKISNFNFLFYFYWLQGTKTALLLVARYKSVQNFLLTILFIFIFMYLAQREEFFRSDLILFMVEMLATDYYHF